MLDNLPRLCDTPNVPRPKRRTQGAAGASRRVGSQTVDTSTLAGVVTPRPEHSLGSQGAIAGNRAHSPHLPESLPEPWLVGSAEILSELERIRGLALAVPLTLESNGAVNSVVDALWRFEQELRYVLRLQAQAQSAFAARSGGHGVEADGAPRSGASPVASTLILVN